MTIDEAIKELQYSSWIVTESHTPEYDEAIRLGVEALMVVQLSRVERSVVTVTQLPSETKD